jgi:Protein of unknown function (DUF3800)
MICGLPTLKRRERIMAMLAAYFDEAGSEPDSPVCFYQGFVSTAEKWKRFSDQWEVLAAKAPETPNFHMVRAWRLKGTETYWGTGTDGQLERRRDRKLMNFTTLIKKHAEQRIHCGLDWRSYEKHLKGKLPPEFDTPLFIGFANVLRELVKWHKGAKCESRIDLIFDDQNRIRNHATAWYAAIVDKIDPHAANVFSGPPTFRDDNDILPLKAADMYGWLMRRNVVDRHASPDGNAPKRQELKVMMRIPGLIGNAPTPFLDLLGKKLTASGYVPPPKKVYRGGRA